VGLIEPQNPADRQELERHSELVLKAMINAAKADGQIDPDEMQRIVGKLNEDISRKKMTTRNIVILSQCIN